MADLHRFSGRSPKIRRTSLTDLSKNLIKSVLLTNIIIHRVRKNSEYRGGMVDNATVTLRKFLKKA